MYQDLFEEKDGLITLGQYHVQVAREELEIIQKERDELQSELAMVKEELRNIRLQLDQAKAVRPFLYCDIFQLIFQCRRMTGTNNIALINTIVQEITGECSSVWIIPSVR